MLGAGRSLYLNVLALWHGNFKLFKDRKSVIFGVKAAPGAPETLPKGGVLHPPPFERVSRAPGAAQAPQNDRFLIFKMF